MRINRYSMCKSLLKKQNAPCSPIVDLVCTSAERPLYSARAMGEGKSLRAFISQKKLEICNSPVVDVIISLNIAEAELENRNWGARLRFP